MKRSLLLAVILLLPLTILSFAQETTPIAYGDKITGEMSADEFEFQYTFTGTEGDIVIIRMKAGEEADEMTSPQITLLRPNGRVEGDTTNSYSYREAILAAELSDDGEFTIVVGRRDGESGESVGEFTLELMLPQLITTETTVENEASSLDTQYYVVRLENDFGVIYQQGRGNFTPEIAVNVLDEDTGGLRKVALIAGEEVSTGVLGMLDDDESYIITVGEAEFDYHFDEVTTDYSLTISENPINLPATE